MGGIGIILNRNAGKRRAFRGQIGEKLAFVLGDPQSLRQTGAIDEIDSVAKAFRERDIDILGIGGGDGSNHYTLTSFIKVYGDHPLPKVAFLCGGTHNAHAASIGLKGKPEVLLERIVRRYHTGKHFDLTRRKIMKVDDGNQVRYGFTLATGFMYRFYHELHIRQDDSQLKVAGLLASWLGSLLTSRKRIHDLFRLERAHISISGKALPWEQNNAVTCSAMEKLGMGFTPYPRANESLHDFQAAALRIKPGSFARLMWGFRGGAIPEHPDIHNTIANHVLVEASEPIAYVLDGEIYHGSQRLEIGTGPRIDLLLA